MLEAIISFLPSEGAGAIGALDWSAEERKRLARLSHSYLCPTCGAIASLLSEPSETEEKPDSTIQEQVSQLHLGPPTATSGKHNFTSMANDLLTGGDGTVTGDPSLPAVEQSLNLQLHQRTAGEVVVQQSTVDLGEDAVDNFEHLQEVEDLRQRHIESPQSPPPVPPAVRPLAVPQPAAHQPADQLRRLEEFLTTLILIILMGIFAILLKVFLRNVTKYDF